MQTSKPSNYVRDLLVAEFLDWTLNKNADIALSDSCLCDDGRVCLKITLTPLKSISLFCPCGYPDYEGYEGGFFVESDSVSCILLNPINEYVLDYKGKLSLSQILQKIVSLNTCAKSPELDPSIIVDNCDGDAVFDNASEDDDDEDIESDGFMDLEENEEEEELERLLAKDERRWRAKDSELRSAKDSKDAQKQSQNAVNNGSQNQVFSNTAALGILINDLKHIIKTSKKTGITAEPIEDNIYEWSVRFNNFESNTKLSEQLKAMKNMYEIDFIEIHLGFAMDLYPFYPPVVKSIRPRLQGSVHFMLVCLDILRLATWDPTCGMFKVLEQIKDHLAKYALLKVGTTFYDKTLGFLETSLLQLALITEASLQMLNNDPSANVAAPTASDKAKKRIGRSFFKQGTGYSTHLDKGWDIKAHLAVEKEKENKIKFALHLILKYIREYLQNLGNESVMEVDLEADSELHQRPSTSKNVAKASTSTMSLDSNDELELASNEENSSSWNALQDLYETIKTSTLLFFIEQKLQVDSFLEICRHKDVYYHIVQILNQVAEFPDLTNLFKKQPGQSSSIYELLLIIKEKASSVLKRYNKAAKTSGEDAAMKLRSKSVTANKAPAATATSKKRTSKAVPSSQKAAKLETTSPSQCEPSASGVEVPSLSLRQLMGEFPTDNKMENSLCEPADDEELAQDFYNLAVKVEDTINKQSCLEESCSGVQREANKLPSMQVNGTVNEDDDLATKYVSELKHLQFGSCDINVEERTSHYYATQFKNERAPGKVQLMRIAQELSALSTSLPLDLQSAIFVRSDDSKINLLKALIIGPEGTPYASGCFLFDIYFPATYPKNPPLVHLCTTGRNTVRFNPNLYADGKVCLSLLGTWSGLSGEQWNETSTLLQVLISIQSLIMVPEPYYNEPGYDMHMGSEGGRKKSSSYNHNVRKETIRLAMVEMLKYPPPGFEEVVQTHFRLKRDRIIKDIKQYVTANASDIGVVFEELKVQLQKL